MTDAAVGNRLAASLSGVTAVLVTPYRAGRVDGELTESIARRVSGSGVHAMAALGNTAEVFQLTGEERRHYLAAVARSGGSVPRIAGFTGAAGQVLAEIDEAARLGYEAAMLHEPPDPFGDSEGMLSYYLYLAQRSALPLVLYLRSERVDFDALRLLAAQPSIVGVKYARRDLDLLSRLLHTDAAQQCVWVNGAAEMRAADFLPLGLTGFTSGIANVRPDLALAVHHALVENDAALLTRALAFVEPVERLREAGNGKFNVAVLKELFRTTATDVGDVRPPHSPLAAAEMVELSAAIASWPPDPRGDASDPKVPAHTNGRVGAHGR